jgi:hypothetical protein
MAEGLSELEAKLERMASAMTEAERHIANTGLSLDQFDKIAQRTGRSLEDVMRHAVRMSEEAEAAAEKAADAIEKAAKKRADDFAADSRRAGDVFAKGVSSELPEKLRDIRAGFRIAGDESHSFETRLKGAAGGAAIAAQAVLALAQKLGEYAIAVRDTAVEQERVAGQAAALGDAMRSISTLTNDTVSVTDAFAMRQALLGQGLRLTGDELGLVARAMRNHAELTGGTAVAATERFAQALASGNLAEFGYLLTQTGTAGQNLAQVMGALSAQEALPRSLGEDLERIGRGFKQLGAGILEATGLLAIARGTISLLSSSLDTLKSTFPSLFQAEETERVEAERGTRARLEAAQSATRLTQATVEQTRAALASAAAAATAAKAHEDAGIKLDQVERRLGGLDAARDAAVRRRTERGDQRAINAQLRREGFSRQDLGMSGGTPSFTREERRDLQQQLAEHLHTLEQLTGGTHQFVRLQQFAGERVEAYVRRTVAAYQRQAEELTRIRDEERIKLDIQAQQENERHENWVRISEEKIAQLKREAVAAHESARTKSEAAFAEAKAHEERHSFSVQASQAAAAAFGNETTMAENAKEGVQMAVGAMTGAFKAHFAAVIRGQETLGQALKGMLEDTLLTIATEAAVKALFAGAQALYFAAIGNYAGAASAAGSAAMFAVVAGAAGAGAYGLSQMDKQPASAGALASGTSRDAGPARAGPASSDAGGGGNTYVFNVNGSATREDAEDAIVRAVDSAAQRGNLPRFARAA